MKKGLFLFFLLVTLSFFQARAENSMRKCLLLPITDSVGGAIAFKVFEKLEESLKESTWCYYRSNSEIINILGQYKQNMSVHLANKDVLKVIAEKTGAGTMIRVDIASEVKGVQVKVLVYGENGEDVYLKEETGLNSDDITLIAQTVKNWLAVYEKSIPYDGKVIGVLGDQFTTDLGKDMGASTIKSVSVIRPIKKRKHPLLKEIVDWETEKIASAKILHATENQSQAKVSEYYTKKRLKIEDWVRLDKTGEAQIVEEKNDRIDLSGGQDFGKIGVLGLFLNIGSGNATVLSDTSTKKIGGFLLGVNFNLEIWAMRNYWAAIEVDKRAGSYSKKEGELSSTSNSMSYGHYKYKMGYRYLPLGFFYGPQIDGYLGYAKYSYGLDTKLTDGFVESSFSGFILGGKGSIPLDVAFRLFLGLEFMAFSSYSEEVKLYGEADSTSNYHLEGGCSYVYSPTMNIEGSLGYTSSKAGFKNPTKEVSFGDTNLKFGVTFTF